MFIHCSCYNLINSITLSAQLHIHPNLDSLQRAIGKQYLPKELGGENGSLSEGIERYVAQLNEFEDYFREDERYAVDEKLREASEREQRQSVVAGVPDCAPAVRESFRKLNID